MDNSIDFGLNMVKVNLFLLKYTGLEYFKCTSSNVIAPKSMKIFFRLVELRSEILEFEARKCPIRVLVVRVWVRVGFRIIYILYLILM